MVKLKDTTCWDTPQYHMLSRSAIAMHSLGIAWPPFCVAYLVYTD